MNNHPEIQVEKPEGQRQLEDIDAKEDAHVATGDVEHPIDLKGDAPRTAGQALIDQFHTIPITGERKTTTKWEYWTYCAFYLGAQGNPIAFSGSSQLQLLLTLQFPDGMVPFAGTMLSISAVMLNLTGIIFAVQFVTLLFIGSYADYGQWRPWVLIGFAVLCYGCQFSMVPLIKPAYWVGATVCYVVGVYAMNMVIAFYAATFPGIVEDLPEVKSSEQDVLNGSREPEEHNKLLSYQRAKLNNLLNVTGSSLQIVSSAIALGIAFAIGYGTDAQLLYSYEVLMGFLSACTILVTVPFFLTQKHRPGQQLPAGSTWYKAGPKQVWSAMKGIRQLKQCLLYLVAYFMLQETYGTYYGVVGILQNDVIQYSPTLLNAMNVVGSVAGGSGNLFVFLLQRKFKFSTKKGVLYGSFMTLLPNLWGAIGAGQTNIGFHKEWEFWFAQAWNFMMAPWASYQIAFLAEVVPAPKAYLFFALFNTVGKTSGFIGPFVSSAITTAAGGNTNMSFTFLFSMGLIGWIILWFVDVDKAKLDSAEYLEREARELYTAEQRLEAEETARI